MKKVKKQNTSYFVEMFKALIVALIVTLCLVLIAAGVVMIFSIPTSAVSIINQIIRGISILIASFFVLRLPKNGWLRGLIFGLLYTILTFLVFSAIDQSFNFGLNLLNDFAFGGIAGLICGIISVNIRKPKK
ncbi:MAG: TIGR04086 family membrane protein [Firmicutes bacterium]|nr:TIGR04086 family membrane protein [Bacillota bacterium]